MARAISTTAMLKRTTNNRSIRITQAMINKVAIQCKLHGGALNPPRTYTQTQEPASSVTPTAMSNITLMIACSFRR